MPMVTNKKTSPKIYFTKREIFDKVKENIDKKYFEIKTTNLFIRHLLKWFDKGLEKRAKRLDDNRGNRSKKNRKT